MCHVSVFASAVVGACHDALPSASPSPSPVPPKVVVPYIEVIKGQVPTASDCAAAIAAVNTTAVEAQYVSLTVCALHSSLGSTASMVPVRAYWR